MKSNGSLKNGRGGGKAAPLHSTLFDTVQQKSQALDEQQGIVQMTLNQWVLLNSKQPFASF